MVPKFHSNTFEVRGQGKVFMENFSGPLKSRKNHPVKLSPSMVYVNKEDIVYCTVNVKHWLCDACHFVRSAVMAMSGEMVVRPSVCQLHVCEFVLTGD